MTIMKAGKETTEAMREACRESKEPTPSEVESAAVHEEVPREEATVESFGALKKGHMDRHLAIRRRQELKKQTQCDGGSWKKLAATCRGMTRCAIPASCKGHYLQEPGRDNVAREVPKGWTFGKRRRAQPEWNNCIRHQGAIWQLCLRKETTTSNRIRGRSRRQELHLGSVKTLYEASRRTFQLEVVKRAVRTPIRLWKMNVRTLWRGWPPLKQKKRRYTE
jgi:hypothetical protein